MGHNAKFPVRCLILYFCCNSRDSRFLAFTVWRRLWEQYYCILPAMINLEEGEINIPAQLNTLMEHIKETDNSLQVMRQENIAFLRGKWYSSLEVESLEADRLNDGQIGGVGSIVTHLDMIVPSFNATSKSVSSLFRSAKLLTKLMFKLHNALSLFV